MGIFGAILFFVAIFIFIYFKLYLFLLPQNRLTVLMYHQIDPSPEDDLTVTPENLEKQFKFLADNGYKSLFFKDLETPKPKSIIITFDDGYLNNYEYLPSLLEKYNLKATLFIPTKYISEGQYNGSPTMSFAQMRRLDPNYFEIGLHSHSHPNFSKINIDDARRELSENMQALDSENIPFSSVFAYPYGRYPKSQEFYKILHDLGIKYAVRIGNGINYYPFWNRYKILRIDIKANDDLRRFRKKLIFGKLKLF